MTLRAAFIAIGMTIASAASAQMVTNQPPDLLGTWTAPKKTANFVFLHRFEHVGTVNKVLNYPTFQTSLGISHGATVQVDYASNSVLVPARPNETQIAIRWRLPTPVTSRTGWLIDGGYNTAARSMDGAVDGDMRTGSISLHVEGRAFSDYRNSGSSRAAIAGGAMYHVNSDIALGGDLGRVMGVNGAIAAWSAGVMVKFPEAPHSLSLTVSNAGTTTLQSASEGMKGKRLYGFTFTLPIPGMADLKGIRDGK